MSGLEALVFVLGIMLITFLGVVFLILLLGQNDG